MGLCWRRDGERMLVIRITENTLGAVEEDKADGGLFECLAQQGVPPALIAQALDLLPRFTTLVLCKPSPEAAWGIQEGTP
jgi:hypothetical protein